MKTKIIFLFVLSALLLTACSGSDTYRGNWKGTDTKGERFELFFDAKSFTVKDSTGKRTKYAYTQNSVTFQNSIETYGITLADGRAYHIVFPLAHDESKGMITDTLGNPLYTINRKAYMTYEELYKFQ